LDTDRDGFTNSEEEFIGTDPGDRCANSGENAWPADVDNNGVVTIQDILAVANKYGLKKGDAGYSTRYDLNTNGVIELEDFFKVAQFYGLVCADLSQIPLKLVSVSNTSYIIGRQLPNVSYTWEACYPACSQGNYRSSGQALSDSSGGLTFSWPSITFKVYAYDKQCSLRCPAPGTPTSVSTNSITLSNLWPSRSYTYTICWPDCNQNRTEFRGEFTTPNCTGSPGATYTAILFKTDGALVTAKDNLTSSSTTFTSLEPNKSYDAFIYTPARDYSRIYWYNQIKSGSGTCTMTETEMQNLVHSLINQNRQANSRTSLTVNSTMVSAARVRSREIKTSFSHTRPDGRGSSTVMDDYGLSFTVYGEILGKNNNPDDLNSVTSIVTEWMNSSAHKSIILTSDFTQMGAGVYKASDGYKYFAVEFRKP